jgi:predicted flap endonuclease-1-like 5' DNA nuclease
MFAAMQHSWSHAMQMETAFAVPFMKRDDETFYDYCLSFSPVAPMFGVPWRFAAAPRVAPATPDAEIAAPAEIPETAAGPVAVATDPVEAAAEPAFAATLAFEEAAAPVDVVDAVPELAPVPAVAALAEVEPEAEAPEPEVSAPAGLYDIAPALIDDLKLIKGVGPKLEAELNGIGIYTFAQIAAMTPLNLIWIDEQISSVRGRPVRDDWAAQAAALAG